MRETFLFNNGIREIWVWDISEIIGWHLHGFWQWLACNRLRYCQWLADSESQWLSVSANHAAASFWTYVRLKYQQQRSRQTPTVLTAACFCKGLTGNSLTDSVTAPAIN